MCTKVTYNILSVGLYSTFGLFMVMLTVRFQEFSSNETSYLNQIARDWLTTPFVNLEVTKNGVCPLGTEEAIYQRWYGTGYKCARYGLFGKWQFYDKCLSEPPFEPGFDLPALPPIL